MILSLHKNEPKIFGAIKLNSSKSISNRVLMIRALCPDHFNIENLSNAEDTVCLNKLLNSYGTSEILDAGAAGTTFRFMTSFLAFRAGTQILTGSERMKKRPIGILVEALRTMGAQIEYLEKEGYPPLKINPPEKKSIDKIKIPANVSSQFISSLMLIATQFENGLQIELTGHIVSFPYIRMTQELMKRFGVEVKIAGDKISVPAGHYNPQDFVVESDWSAASYFYSLAALSEEAEIRLEGLQKNSLQGDSAIARIMGDIGVETQYFADYLIISKSKIDLPDYIEIDFNNFPDLAQTLAVTFSGLGLKSHFSGLSTLRIKETDRIQALKNELQKVALEIEDGEDYLKLSGKAIVKNPTFKSYEDHRMALALSAFALGGNINIEDPEVVKKSYPDYWNDLQKLGFTVELA